MPARGAAGRRLARGWPARYMDKGGAHRATAVQLVGRDATGSQRACVKLRRPGPCRCALAGPPRGSSPAPAPAAALPQGKAASRSSLAQLEAD
eukprot:scaffold1318_cov388-Prasinococcus_capsulatus_cf.AAC.94